MKKGNIVLSRTAAKISFLVVGLMGLRLFTGEAFAYPNCNAPDIEIGNYTIAACNIGTTIAGTGPDSYGFHYQRGRNVDFPVPTVDCPGPTCSNSYEDAITTGAVPGPLSLTDANNTTGFIKNGTSPYDWLASQDDNLWGGANDSEANGQSGVNTLERQGPCPNGFHVPSAGERGGVLEARWSSNSGDFGGGDLGYESGLAYKGISGIGTKFTNDLLLPLSALRNQSVAHVSYRDLQGFYWSSSVKGTNGRDVFLGADFVTTRDTRSRAYGFSIRCFKNTPPLITLLGDNSLTSTIYDFYTELGAEWTDNGVTGAVVNIDTSNLPLSGGYLTAIGTYSIFYSYTNIAGTIGTGERILTILPQKLEPTNSGGGGISLVKDSCPNGDFSPSYYDKTCGTTANLTEEVAQKVNILRPVIKLIYLTATEEQKTFVHNLITSCSEANKNEVIKLACQELVENWDF